ncbi:putative nucleic acid binding AN1-type Zn finger protein [Dysgonomonas sp. PFB1-18]|uniref:hypothetical protein n=1 Tax=unclassified Dysgonomonas TaxID=2630389 RepID=UPI00247680E6|nr:MULTISPECIES: hypothetical protein [unclassified Dysgonomonas]MDH6307654.1 putative nucleic acid binding AN1-type Zn finger protein [Dysgonomonas sp. PF1-14]MDH6337572.1 putative nucleic acid binding AN1-type Zn finger protein [Dysgonomonas sp. PF1-16]MDH6378796.1 putative nucleic acid binding AN1-type Zn finger protein [Dysgonomonas sp. PFB1-18]MDH6399214.1 putative nucleic acid binding AN1-type Zn finger protein [Dysgonomonas sp. PF1-23]
MKKIILLILICIATSCASHKDIASTDNNMKKVTTGMSKKKVISIMGDNYEVISSQNNTYTLGYKTADNGVYKLVFTDDKLVKWNKEQRKGKPAKKRRT